MITTKEINVNLDKGRPKLKRITTKDIDANIKIKPPKEPVKTQSISTRALADIADIAEKKRRDDIMAERKASRATKGNDKELAKLNMQFVFVEIDGIIQAYPRRELKWKEK